MQKSLVLKCLTLICVLALYSCKKEEKAPSVVTSSFEDGGDENLLVNGLIVNGAEVDAVGFSYSKSNPMPEQGDYVREVNQNGQTFTATLNEFAPGDSVFARAWAKQNGKYYYGAVLSRAVKKNADPTIPCTLTANKIKGLNGVNYTVNGAYKGGNATWGVYRIEASCGSMGVPSLYFEFFEIPKTGIYTTCAWQNWGAKKVYAQYHDFDVNQMTPGRSVYVKKNTNGSYTIDMCDCEFMFKGGSNPIPVHVSGNFTTN